MQRALRREALVTKSACYWPGIVCGEDLSEYLSEEAEQEFFELVHAVRKLVG
jgi:hypothetical protein